MNPAQRRPNILMVISDQERADALGSYGNPICSTPVLDRFAAEGVRFDACFAPSPICSPCRASLLTGLYPHGHGVLNNTHEPDAIRREIPPEIPTYSELLRDNGYRLGYVGKWHVGPGGPESRGFHDVVGLHDNLVASVGEDSIVETEPDLLEPVYARYPRGKLLIAGIDARPEEATETRRDTDGPSLSSSGTRPSTNRSSSGWTSKGRITRTCRRCASRRCTTPHPSRPGRTSTRTSPVSRQPRLDCSSSGV